MSHEYRKTGPSPNDGVMKNYSPV